MQLPPPIFAFLARNQMSTVITHGYQILTADSAPSSFFLQANERQTAKDSNRKFSKENRIDSDGNHRLPLSRPPNDGSLRTSRALAQSRGLRHMLLFMEKFDQQVLPLLLRLYLQGE